MFCTCIEALSFLPADANRWHGLAPDARGTKGNANKETLNLF